VTSAVLSTALGCGRIAFEPGEPALACTEVGHDEDGDGIDDACDVCPQLSDAEQSDADGDRVGDVCDPHPDEARDQLVLFDPFLEARPEWTYRGISFELRDDSLFADSRDGQFRADLTGGGAPAKDSYSVAMRIGAGGIGQRQIAIYALELDTRLYFCDLDQNQNGGFWALVFTLDGTSFGGIDQTDAALPLENGSLLMRMKHEPGFVECETDWPATKPVVMGAPAGVSPVVAAISVIGLEIELKSFVHIRSN
jgi:hypothetical protein